MGGPLSPEVKRPGREADHSPLSNTEVKKAKLCLHSPIRLHDISKSADKSSAFPISYFLSAAQPKEFFFDGLKKLEQQSHKCVELRGECVEYIHSSNPAACCFLYKAKDLSPLS
jgi:hypothetical protein